MSGLIGVGEHLCQVPSAVVVERARFGDGEAFEVEAETIELGDLDHGDVVIRRVDPDPVDVEVLKWDPDKEEDPGRGKKSKAYGLLKGLLGNHQDAKTAPHPKPDVDKARLGDALEDLQEDIRELERTLKKLRKEVEELRKENPKMKSRSVKRKEMI